jgi:hypothetical protein
MFSRQLLFSALTAGQTVLPAADLILLFRSTYSTLLVALSALKQRIMDLNDVVLRRTTSLLRVLEAQRECQAFRL